MRHSDMRLTMNVYTDPKLLDIHAALNSLPSLNAPAIKTVQATGTAVVESNVPHNVPPGDSRNETIQDNWSGNGDLASDAEKQEKPRENIGLPELFEVDPNGIEPSTSTLPV
jgi:hypothetical protein